MAETNYEHKAQELAAEFEQAVLRLEHYSINGNINPAVYKLILERRKQMGNALIASYLEAFELSGLGQPNEEELTELDRKFETLFAVRLNREPVAWPVEVTVGMKELDRRACERLRAETTKLKLRLQQRDNSTYTMKIEQNYGAALMGHDNIQETTINNKSVDDITDKLIKIIQNSSLKPLEKGNAMNAVYQIQHLETLNQSVTVNQQKLEQTNIIDSLLSRAADAYTIAVPLISLLKTTFGV